MPFRKILVSNNGAAKEISASIDSNILSSSMIVATNTASVGLSNGLMIINNNILSTITGSATNHVLKYTGSQIQTVEPYDGSTLKRYGDIEISTSGALVRDISNVNSGTLTTPYGGTSRNSYLSGTLLVNKNGAGIDSSSVDTADAPLVLADFNTTSSTDQSISANAITFGGNTVTVAPVGLSPGNLLGLNALGTLTGSSPTYVAMTTHAGDFTVEGWVYFRNGGSNAFANASCVIFGNSADKWLPMVAGDGINASTGVFSVWDGSQAIRTNLSFSANQWYHIALTRTEDILRLYANATASSDIAAQGGILNMSSVVVGSNGNSSFNVNGYIKELTFSKFAKTTSEIKNYYNAIKAGTKGSRTKYDTPGNKIIVVGNDNSLILRDERYLSIAPRVKPLVYLYTGTVNFSVPSSTTTYTWTKPANCRFIRVICQGAGGAGTSGRGGTVSTGAPGSGGGGGGYSDMLFNAQLISNTVVCTVGDGGGAAGISTENFTGIWPLGRNGGNSSFGNYLYATGGQAAVSWQNNTVEGIAGLGYRYNGSNGSRAIGDASSVYLGGAGGGAGGGLAQTGRLGGSITALSISPGAGGVGTTISTAGNAGAPGVGSMFNFTSCTFNNITNQAFPNLIYAGGSGGGGNNGISIRGGDGSTPLYGSGGGGGGMNGSDSQPTRGAGRGGNGGRGYILIICY